MEEIECEERFLKDPIIRSDGRFQVKLPFKISPQSENFLGDSYNQAKFRLLRLEKRFEVNTALKEKYSEIINEYLELNHMHEASESEINDTKRAYFLPHHAVMKESSTTTKVRVVYDASAKTSNGKSLNEQLLVGPTVQEDVFSILIRWRMFKIGFTSDIEKMYRQIIMDPDDAKFQRILWRNNPNEEIKQYILDTVTFGTASAPYQATRSLIKISDDVTETHPECSKILKLSCYVDDVVSGSHDIN